MTNYPGFYTRHILMQRVKLDFSAKWDGSYTIPYCSSLINKLIGIVSRGKKGIRSRMRSINQVWRSSSELCINILRANGFEHGLQTSLVEKRLNKQKKKIIQVITNHLSKIESIYIVKSINLYFIILMVECIQAFFYTVSCYYSN